MDSHLPLVALFVNSQLPLVGLFWVGLVLLGGVTLGVGYLTWAQWRDWRRQQEQNRPCPVAKRR